MHSISIQNNPYQMIYRQVQIPEAKDMTKKDAEELVRHLGFIYNTFGTVMKDFIKVVGVQFDQNSQSSVGSKTVPKEGSFIPNENIEKKFVPCRQSQNQIEPQLSIKVNPAKKKEIDTEKEKVEYLSSNQYDLDFDLENFTYNQEEKPARSSGRSKKSDEFKKEDQEKSNHFFNQFSRKQAFQKKVSKKKVENNSKSELNLSSRGSEQNKMRIIEEEDDISEESANKYQRLNERVRYNHEEDEAFSRPSIRSENEAQVRILPGRSKKERENFKGIECPDCQRYYRTMGIEGGELCECSSRHKSNLPMRRFGKNNFTQQLDLD